MTWTTHLTKMSPLTSFEHQKNTNLDNTAAVQYRYKKVEKYNVLSNAIEKDSLTGEHSSEQL